MAYTVRFGRFEANPKKMQWTVLKEVAADGVVVETGHRWFHFTNDLRLEVPTDGMVFEFAPERYKQIMEAQRKESEKTE